MTSTISDLADRIRAAFPLARVDMDPPLHEGGKFHVDIRLGDRLVVVEWGEKTGFGVSLVIDAALDGAPDFRLANLDGALGIVKLLLSEAQDADFGRELGSWTAEATDTLRYEDLAVTERERRVPRRKAA
jgi:hypothetical protein